jgi:hypothetical protein
MSLMRLIAALHGLRMLSRSLLVEFKFKLLLEGLFSVDAGGMGLFGQMLFPDWLGVPSGLLTERGVRGPGIFERRL